MSDKIIYTYEWVDAMEPLERKSITPRLPDFDRLEAKIDAIQSEISSLRELIYVCLALMDAKKDAGTVSSVDIKL